MDLEIEESRGRYLLCRWGFLLTAVALGVLSGDTALWLLSILQIGPNLNEALHSNAWFWVVATPIPWTSFLGAALLWGRWDLRDWKRLSTPLLLFCSIDLAMWGLEAHDRFSAGAPNQASWWLIGNLIGLMGWVELILTAKMARLVEAHFQPAKAQDLDHSAESLCGMGLVLAGLSLLCLTNWHHWPLNPGRRGPLAWLTLYVVPRGIFVFALFQLTVRCMRAARYCSQYLQDLESPHFRDDLLKSRSEIEFESEREQQKRKGR